MAEPRKSRNSINLITRKKFFDALESGFTPAQSAKIACISPASGYRFISEAKKAAAPPAAQPNRHRIAGLEARREMTLRGPVPIEELSSEALEALEDFGKFRLRYFGRIATPWQIEAAMTVVRLLATESEEYLVINCPPGAGKTTLLHDIICWVICRNRSIRILMGSATLQQAEKSARRVRKSLERVIPFKASSEDISRGLAVDALSTMALDYGRFKPLDRGQWTNSAFIVESLDEESASSEKESTVQAYGMDANFLGDRVDLALWDDLVDPRTTRSVELREQLEERWVDIAESRLDPGGLLGLIGQRLASDDLYRFALDMVQPLNPEDEDMMDEMSEEEIAAIRRDKKYHHIKFKAHYEENCAEGSHKLSAAPYPVGCLLDPRRLSWRKINGMISNSSSRFQVLYQQEDIAPNSTLTNNDEIYGYGGFPGCIDPERDDWQVPADFRPDQCIVVATVDPSPTKYWACLMWIYHPPSNTRNLITLVRKAMDAPDFLDFIDKEDKYVGLMEDWQRHSREIGFPIQYWVIEQNAAQRFILRYDHVKRWIAMNGTQIVPHDTNTNKLSAEYGVMAMHPNYQFGRVRLPGKGAGRLCSLKLIDEAIKYPHGRTDDCIMAQWFLEWNLHNLSRPSQSYTLPKRPSWAKNRSRMQRAG